MGNPFIRGYGTVWALQTCAGCNQRQSVSASNGFHCAESIIPLTRTPLSPIWGFVLLERVWHGTKAMNVRVIWTPVVLHVVFILLILFFLRMSEPLIYLALGWVLPWIPAISAASKANEAAVAVRFTVGIARQAARR